MNTKMILVLAALLPLAACASQMTPKQRADYAMQVQAAALAPVNHINLTGSGFYAWKAINDHQIVSYLTPKRAYLFDLPPCPGLEQTQAILISSRMGQVNIRFDSVTTSQMGVPCQIQRIRPLDMQKLKAADQAVNTNVQLKSRPASKDSMK